MTPDEILAQRLYHQLPRHTTAQQLQHAYDQGLMPKQDLVDEVVYWGWCRNASQARWDAAQQRFVYIRTKFGHAFEEDIVHPADDEGFDVFAVVAPVAPADLQRPPSRGPSSAVLPPHKAP